MSTDPITPGRVYLVGAGPGDPGLITARGLECLARADLVLADYLVNPAILEQAPAGAEIVGLGGHRQGRIVDQEEINTRMIEAARRGRTVVRLKGGDPDLFARGAEETAALRAAGIPYEVVPGVTAALAAAACAGVPITHGEHSSAVALVTGQERSEKAGAALDYGALAGFPGTLVFYMGVTSARVWSEALLDRGRSPATPVMIVRRASWSDQETIRTTLGAVAAVIAERHVRPPAVVIVGEVVRLAPESSWFQQRPLFGTRVLVTRPRGQAEDLARPLRELGAEVLLQAAIEILPPPDWSAVDAALDRLRSFGWLVFSSANGVRALVERLWSRGGDLRRLADVRLATIGPGTADELARYHLRADLVPHEYRAERLAEALTREGPCGHFLLVRASRGREVLADRLAATGAEVTQVVAYLSRDVEQAKPYIVAAVTAGRIDWITVTSSAIARALARMFGEGLRRARLASISPITSAVIRELGYEPAAEALEYTMPGIVRAIAAAERARDDRG